MTQLSSGKFSAELEGGPANSDRPFRLSAFRATDAAEIASWVLNDCELLWLAPGTPPPLTAETVLAWGRERRFRLVLRTADGTAPCGYAELNDMPQHPEQMWIGHFIINPAWRYAGLGTRFAQALISIAFERRGATDVLLVVFPENVRAIRCYERAGLAILGSERKHFPATGRSHVFCRMGIHESRYRRLMSGGKINPLIAYPDQ